MWSVAISADGEHIAAGSFDCKVYLFDKDSSTPLWNYTTGDWVGSVAISADGEYIAAGSLDNKVYLLDEDINQDGGGINQDDDDSGGSIPALSLTISMAAVFVIALRRRSLPR